jgi:hypothetical protein
MTFKKYICTYYFSLSDKMKINMEGKRHRDACQSRDRDATCLVLHHYQVHLAVITKLECFYPPRVSK